MSAEEARYTVRNSKYQPIGLRGQGSCGYSNDFLATATPEGDQAQNENTFVVLEIEDKEALDCLDEILDVPGYEMVFIGPGDLTSSLAAHGDARPEALSEAYEKLAAALKKHPDKYWAVTCNDMDEVKKFHKMGARFFNLGADVLYMMLGFQKDYDDFHAFVDRL